MPTCYPTISAQHHMAKPGESLQLWSSTSGETIVLCGFNGKRTRSKCLTSAAKGRPASTRDRPKTNMFFAKRKSGKLGPPSIKLKPTFPTSALHSRISHCNTEQNKRGLSTHPCRMPPVVLNLVPCPCHLPLNSPHCPKYRHCKIHARQTKIPSSTRAVHDAGQCTRSNAFDKSKLMIHTGISTASALSKTKLAATMQNQVSCVVVVVAEIHAVLPAVLLPITVLYNKRIFAIGLKSAGRNAEQRLAPWLESFNSN